MFDVQNLSVFGNFGKKLAKDITFKIQKGEIFCLLGVNGAGKTSIAKAIAGHLDYLADKIDLNNESLKNLKSFDIAKKGLSYVSEEKQIIASLTVLEHLEVVLTVDSFFRDQKKRAERYDFIFNLFPILFERKKQLATHLSGGEQQMLCLALALIKNPYFLILDEPSQGLSVKVLDQFLKILIALKEKGLSILLIEQNIYHATEIADKGAIIQNGSIILSGDTSSLKNHPDFKKICLGLY
ncbi:MAG: ABC transporter ATP-binding protein [Proteobacteria bacterium]|nr:ABC transporter ATP-binding protein [Pseudomonadota bacterium]